MERYEYICLSINIIPKEILTQYNLRTMDKNGYFYADIRKGMCGFPQEGRMENDFLNKNIVPHRYYQCRHTPGLGRHRWRPVILSFVVDGI